MRVDRATAVRRTTSLTALVDVVFLLLLFFMLASSFSRFSVIEVGLGGTGAPGAPRPESADILLTVDADGGLALNGARVASDDLVAALQAASGEGPRRILVRPTARANTQDIVSALESARAAAAGDVILVR